MSTVIKIENLYKEYRLGVIGHGTLYRDLQSWWATTRGKEDPNSLIGQGGHRMSKGSILALKDINLDVQQGDLLGIIGANGAGKSTLLKVLSKITTPTRGTVKYKGRIASLLEVGTGFHSELTGRENIFLNGAINGMSRKEVAGKLDEIVEFAGVEAFLDTPVKRLSSGMYVRLGFAVAAHLDPDILIVDEVLAVGDAGFQKKAVDKMEDVTRSGGRTVLFVSHNMSSVERLCKKAVLIDKGAIKHIGPTRETIEKYLDQTEEENLASTTVLNDHRNPSGLINSIRMLRSDGAETSEFIPGNDVTFELNIDTKGQVLKTPRILIVVFNKRFGNICKFITSHMVKDPFTIRGKSTVRCVWESCPLLPGIYDVHLKLTGTQSGNGEERYLNVISFKILHQDPYGTGREFNDVADCAMLPIGRWEIENHG